MIYIIFLIIAICIGGILLFTKQITPGKRSRQQYLTALEHFLEAPLMPVEETKDSYRIAFRFEKHDFVYEDMLYPGFKGNINRSYIKGKTGTDFGLDFTEREQKGMIHQTTEKQPKVQKTKIHLPKTLDMFSAHSNQPVLANKLLKDSAVVRVLAEFKNVDHRGRPLMTMKVSHGHVVLDFHPSERLHPKPLSQLASFEQLEDYLDKMIIVMKRIESYQKKA